MTDHIQLPPPDYTENVQGFVHDTQRHYYAEETMRAYAERLHAARVKTLPTQLMAGLQTEIDALRHQLQTLAELGDASGDAQILRMGYAAARLEIERLNTQLQAAREEIKRRDAQEAAIGSGGVEPLRRRECLHQISEPEPAAVAGPSDSEIDALVVSIGPTEGIRRDSRDLTMDKLRVLVHRALATWGHVKVAPNADSVLEDAARYRWLRERMLGIDFDWNENGITALSFEMPDGCSYGGCCDQNIDAARSQAKEGGA